MDIRFVAPDLRRLDQVQSEACWLPFFRDERPFRGVLGLIDWRMGAYLSRQIIRGRICGNPGDLLLMPCGRFLPFEKLFLYGLGLREAFDENRYSRGVEDMLASLERMKTRTAVCALPGRSTEDIGPVEAISGLLAAARPYEDQEITIVEPAPAQRLMEPVIAQERRRERADEP